MSNRQERKLKKELKRNGIAKPRKTTTLSPKNQKLKDFADSIGAEFYLARSYE